MDAKALKNLVFEIKSSQPDTAVIITNIAGPKVMLYVGLSKSLVENHGLHAGKMIKELASKIHGGGGGQADFATAGGSHQGGIDSLFLLAQELISKED